MKKIISLILIAIICILSIYSTSADSSYVVMREPVYNMADSFYSNVTKVSKGSLWGICDTNGYLLTDYKWEAMGEITDELIPARLNGLWGYISVNGDEKIPYQFQKAENFVGDIARVLTADNKYAYINRSGEIEIVSPFDYSFTLSEGVICGVADGLYGYCDTSGNIIITPQFDMGMDFHDGLASVKFGEKWGYITSEGAYKIKPTYNYASDFSGGFAVCSLETGYGIIDTNGNRTSPFTFDYIGICDNMGRFPAKQGNISGYINAQGDWLMQLNYDFCYNFTDGVARVFKDNLWGYINEKGEEIVAPTFFDCGEYRNNRAFYSIDGQTYGFLTLDTKNYKNEEVVVPTNPAQSDTNDEAPTLVQKDDSVGTYEEIIDVNDLNNIPTFPSEEGCITMKIESPYALRRNDAKKLSAPPKLLDGVTMVPLRDVVEYMGGKISWDAKTQRVNITLNRNRIIITVGSKICFVNGVPQTVASAPALLDGVTMMPVRSVATNLGCEVLWIPETQNIHIRY